jgi:GcrA cell cycle regulator
MTGWNEGIARDLWREGKSATEIAMYFGMTRNAVCGRLWRMGLKREGAASYGIRQRATPKPPRAKKFKAVKPPMPPRVEAVVVVPVVVDIMAARPFLSRTMRECSWILDDGNACCNPSDGGTSYCAGHRAIVYRPTGKPKDYERSLRRYVA